MNVWYSLLYSRSLTKRKPTYTGGYAMLKWIAKRLHILKDRTIYMMEKCGHTTAIKGPISAFGESIIISMPPKENGSVKYCLACIEKMTIRCAWCGKPIFIGDPITLYVPASHFTVPDYAVPYTEEDPRRIDPVSIKEPARYVGCLGWECALSGVDRVGFWYPPGKVKRVPSPLEIALGSGGKAIIVNDLSNPNDTGTIVK